MNHNQQIILHSQNIQELRQILTQIGHSNEFECEHTFVQNYIQELDRHQQFRLVLESYVQQLSKKKTMINNVVNFSFQILNYAQQKTFQLQNATNKSVELQTKITELCKQNELLISKLHRIQEQTQNYKQKLEGAETYISQISQQKSELQVLKLNEKQAKNLFYQIQYYSQSRSQKVMEKSDEANSLKFLTLIKAKDDQIIYLETQIAKMQQRFIKLQQELQSLKNQSQISQILSKTKNYQQVDCLPQESIMIEKQLSKVNSCSSFYQQSQKHSQFNEKKSFQNQEQNYQHSSQGFNQSQQQEQCQTSTFIESIIRNKHERQSLKYEVFDFCSQTFKNIQLQNEQIYCTLQIKSTAVGTENIQKVSKGIQVDYNPKIIRKSCKNNMQFQKNDIKQKEAKQQIKKPEVKKQKSILMSIFDFAVQKAVRSRIKCKTYSKK